MKILLSLLILLNIIKAEIVFDDMASPVKEEIMNYDTVDVDDNDSIPQDELKKNQEEILEDVITTKHEIQSKNRYSNEQNLFLNIKNAPKKVILSQRFAVTIKATITRTDVDKIYTKIVCKDCLVSNPKESWKKIDENSFIVTYFLKFLSTTPKQPTFKVIVKYNDGFKNRSTITLNPIKVVALKGDEFFCDVIAKNIKIVQHTEKKFDELHNIVLLELDANMSNVEDFKIPYAKKSGVDEFIDYGNTQKAYTYAIIKNNLKKFKFKYFNSNINHYKMLSFDISLKDQTLSTQTDLNPRKNRYNLYKTIALLVLAFVIFVIVAKNRSIILGVIGAAILLYVLYINIPLKTITLKKGVGLKILPTQNSTIFYFVPQDTDAVVVYENKKFYKVILPDNKHIGWVKKDVK